MSRLSVCVLGSAVALASAGAAYAGTATTNFNVKMTVAAGCTVSSAGDINFGTVSATAASVPNASTSLAVKCSNTTPYKITFTGQHDVSGTSGATKQMAGTGSNQNRISYNLVQTSAPTVNLGSSQTTNALSGTGTGATQTYGLSAKIMNWATTVAAPDNYSDIVTVAVNY